MLDIKKWVAKVTKAVDTPCVVAVTFTQVITSKTTGSKTASATISVPSGYEVIPNCRPVSLYISGAGTVTVADRGVVNMNGTTASFTYYLNNPNSYTGSLGINASILCRRVGGVLLNSIFKAFSDFASHLFGGDVNARYKETDSETVGRQSAVGLYCQLGELKCNDRPREHCKGTTLNGRYLPCVLRCACEDIIAKVKHGYGEFRGGRTASDGLLAVVLLGQNGIRISAQLLLRKQQRWLDKCKRNLERKYHLQNKWSRAVQNKLAISERGWAVC